MKPVLEYIVKHPELTPKYAHPTDSGFDLMCAVEKTGRILPGKTYLVPLGVVFNIPIGYEIQLRPKSGLASKGISVIFGTVDSGYRGELKAMVYVEPSVTEHVYFQFGEKVCQGVLVPVIQPTFKLVDEIPISTERGAEGFGSTGRWGAGRRSQEVKES
jgi:dUTP pyrophosphatase